MKELLLSSSKLNSRLQYFFGYGLPADILFPVTEYKNSNGVFLAFRECFIHFPTSSVIATMVEI